MRCHDVRKAATSVSISALLACLCAGLAGCIQPWHGVFNNNPNIGWGGRVVALTVDPADDNFVIAASPTGGLFETALGGSAWGHIEAMPEFGVFDVRIDPDDSNIIIATTIEDTRIANGGGIWFSDDRGQSWIQPPTSIRRLADGSIQPYSAFGIFFLPGTKKVFVGTDQGLAESDDSGARWTFVNPQTGSYFTSMYSVVALSTGRVITYGDDGIWISDDGKTNWHHDNSSTSFQDARVANSLAVSPLNQNDVFLTDDYQNLHYSSDGGLDWTVVDSEPAPTSSVRQPTVKIAQHDSSSFDLYWEIGSGLNVKRVTQKNSGLDFSAAWNALNPPHSDPADLAFSRSGALLYMADDGGIEKTFDGGSTFKPEYRGNASNGLDALQVYDVKAVLSGKSSAENDVYFGTQDNNLYASGDSGGSWPGLALPEGGNIRGPMLKGSGNYTIIHSVYSNPEISGPVFSNPPAAPITFPFDLNGAVYYVRDNEYFAFAQDNSGGSSGFVSGDGGYHWAGVAGLSVSQDIMLYAQVSGPHDNPSLIVPFADAGVVGLLRIDNAFSRTPNDEVVTPIPLPRGASLGLYGFQYFSDVASFGVDPNDPNFLIVPDVAGNKIYITSDGGMTWTERDDLLARITDYGAFKFSTPDGNRSGFELSNAQVSAIAFDPQNPNRILIGTAEAGIVYSSDHGTTWNKINGSERIPNVTSFAFLQTQNPEEAYASSWGRGLWTVSLDIGNLSWASRAQFTVPAGPAPIPAGPAPGTGRGTGQGLMVRGDIEEARRRFFDTTTPRLRVRTAGAHFLNGVVAAAQPIEIQGLYWPRMSAGALIVVGLDGHAPIRVPVRVTKAGTFSALLPAMQIAGRHRLDVRQMVGSKQIASAKREFTVVVADEDHERERR